MLRHAVHTCTCMSHDVEHVQYICVLVRSDVEASSLGHQRLLRQLFLQLLWSELPIHPDPSVDHLANPWSLLLLSTNFLIPMFVAVGTPIYNSLKHLLQKKRPLDTPNISQATSTTTHESQIVLDVLVTHIEIHTQYGPWFWPEILDLFPAASNRRNSLKRYSICDRTFEIVSVFPTSTSNLLLYCKYQETSRLSPLRLFRQPFLQLLCLCWLSIIQINQETHSVKLA